MRGNGQVEFDTKSIHTGMELDPHTGASSYPIYQASTFKWPSWDTEPEFAYSRSSNPTRLALEEIVRQLEGGVRGFAFASGMAAISAVFLTLSAGDHVVAAEDIYGGTLQALTKILPRFGIDTTFADATDLNRVEAAIRPNTKALMLETPSNPTLQITDLRAAAKLARDRGLVSIVDNTFMSPYLQRPHDLGVDIVVHSATKYFGGHSDVLAGLVSVRDEELGNRVFAIQNGFGAVLGPQDAFLLMRGIKTLSVRLRQSQETAGRLAAFFSDKESVAHVYYPGLKDHPGRLIHESQANGPGAMLSFDLGNAARARTFVERAQLPLFGVSLGGVETIISHPARMSHAAMAPEKRLERGITDGLLRLSVGLEAAPDLMDDFSQALQGL